VAEQERRLAKTESVVRVLERSASESAREQLSNVLSAKMSSEVLQQANEAAMQKQILALEATRAEVAALDLRVGAVHEEQAEQYTATVVQATAMWSAKQEEWYKEKDHEQYLLAVSRKERQDHQLVHALSKKADVAWYEQQKAIIDATQVSLTALNGGHQELHLQLMDKVDNHTLEKQHLRLQQEIAQVRQDTADVARKLDRHREHLDMARAQLLEVIRQQGEVEVALSMKADKVGLEHQEEQLEDLRSKVFVLEQRQEVALREVGHLRQDVAAHNPHGHTYSGGGIPPGILQPPSCPRDDHCGRRSPRGHKASPYTKPRKA